MDLLAGALESQGVRCVEKESCPDSMFSSPLVGENSDDLYVLHFYDLSAKVPHSMYTFVRDLE